jgi:phosphoesterase RecJ-like protein
VVITAHRSPDGDALGSALGLCNHLKNMGFTDVQVMLPDGFPAFYQWMPGADQVILFDKSTEDAKQILTGAQFIFCLDFNALNRLGKEMEAAMQAVDAPVVMIDHHMHPTGFATWNFDDSSCGSTAELIYRWIQAAGQTSHLTPATASCLYTGVMTDTGSFRFPSVSPATHRMVAQLLETGMSHADIHAAVYDSNRLDRLKLMGYALSEKLEVNQANACAMIVLTLAELNRYHAQSGDTEGLVNQALSIEGVNCAVFIREAKHGRVKLSLRSRGAFSVREVAEAHFNGGGHHNAAGGALDGLSTEEVAALWRSLIPQYGPAMRASC